MIRSTVQLLFALVLLLTSGLAFIPLKSSTPNWRVSINVRRVGLPMVPNSGRSTDQSEDDSEAFFSDLKNKTYADLAVSDVSSRLSKRLDQKLEFLFDRQEKKMEAKLNQQEKKMEAKFYQQEKNMAEFSSMVTEKFNQQEKKMEDINKQLAPLVVVYGLVIAVITAVITGLLKLRI